MVWIPDWTAELQFWPNQWFVGNFFDVWFAAVEMSTKETRDPSCLGGDVTDMKVPGELGADFNTQVFVMVDYF